RSRLVEAVETAARLGQGVVTVHRPDRQDLVFSTERACPRHPDLSIPELEPRLFSFNAPQGACPSCRGLGVLDDFQIERLIVLAAPGDSCSRAFYDEGRLPFSHLDKRALAPVLEALNAPRGPVGRWPERVRERL